MLSFCSQHVTSEEMAQAKYSSLMGCVCCRRKLCCSYGQCGRALLLQLTMRGHHGAGERTSRGGGHSGFSNVWVWFDSISPTDSFKPFPRDISFQFQFPQRASCSSLPILPEISPSWFCLEAAILDIGALISTGRSQTFQVPSVSCLRVRPVRAQALSHHSSPSCSLA